MSESSEIVEPNKKDSKGQLTRRTFLKQALRWGSVATVIGVELKTSYSIPLSIADIFIDNEFDSEVEEGMAHLQERYGCRIDFGQLKTEGYNGHDVPLARKKRILEDLKDILSLYPPELIQRMGIAFQITTRVKAFGGYPPGVAEAKMHLDSQGKWRMKSTLKLSVYTTKELKEIIHHEISHLVDKLVSSVKDDPHSDEWGGEDMNKEWATLNAPETESYYFADKERFMTPINFIRRIRNGSLDLLRLGHFPGYVSEYALKNANEDQAETMRFLMIDYELAQKIADPVLQEKFKRAKEYYRTASQGKMDDQFWKDLIAGKVNEAYWGQL